MILVYSQYMVVLLIIFAVEVVAGFVAFFFAEEVMEQNGFTLLY